ncbi:hypothetical protein HY496_02215 [Candidatus Woesearchaeota archaeon]|nr:hypothetical protein [Candidatus Woesearchaeota archaeon]
MKRQQKKTTLSRVGNSLKTQRTLFFVLLAIVILLSIAALAKVMGFFIPSQPVPVIVENTIRMNSLTLDQKIAQMIIVSGQKWNVAAWKKLQIGGIHLFAKANESIFRETIDLFQEKTTIPFFVSVDLEGCHNPFATFKNFTAASDIKTVEAAYQKGVEEGSYLSSVGITINFAPVVDLQDTIWKCRSFPGDAEQITDLAGAYTQGVQEQDIVATAKHYPGKTLVVHDPHKYLVAATISDADTLPFEALSPLVKAVMVSHVISSGAVDSRGVPAVASPEAIQELRSAFSGLIITDEINMLGLKKFYPSLDDLYIAVFAAGSDIIINFNEDPHEIRRMISIIRAAVEKGEISESRIDDSVRRILQAKGFIVV